MSSRIISVLFLNSDAWRHASGHYFITDKPKRRGHFTIYGHEPRRRDKATINCCRKPCCVSPRNTSCLCKFRCVERHRGILFFYGHEPRRKNKATVNPNLTNYRLRRDACLHASFLFGLKFRCVETHIGAFYFVTDTNQRGEHLPRRKTRTKAEELSSN